MARRPSSRRTSPRNKPTTTQQPIWALSRYRILQIGDVHFPQWKEVHADVDHKDKSFARSLTSAIARNPLQTILREIARLVHFEPYDAVTLMGDLTNWGDLPSYELALKILSPLLDVEHQIKNRRPMVLVPGNHDIQRSLALIPPIETKFNTLLELFDKYKWPRFPLRNVTKFSFPDKSPICVIYPLNTCWGCGEKRHLPKTIRDQVLNAVSATANLPADLETLEELFEQLDTPALPEGAIQDITRAITALPSYILPVLVAHHNLLPQATPRLAPYSELLNGGQLRRQLLRTGRTVLFLHGHIHEDPVEILTDPSLPGGQIVSVSAPCLADGFNEIELFTSRMRGVVGCRVHRIRFKAGQGLSQEDYIDIGLRTKIAMESPIAYLVMNALSVRRRAFFSEVLDDIASKDTSITEDELTVATQELHFAGQLIIENPTDEPVAWCLRM